MLQKFINTVIHPVLGEYVSKVHVVTLDHDQMQKIQKIIALERPEKFLSDTNLYTAGVMMKDQCILPDSSCGPTLSIEIKPKLGIMHSDFQPDLCNFCQKQEKKLKKDQNYAKSRYCPLDLFSGDQDRMIEALNNLMLNPQNNMMFFKDGILLDDVQSKNFISSTFGDKTFLPQILVSLLTSEPDCDDINLRLDKSSQIRQNKTTSCNQKFQDLPEKCILNTILTHQKIILSEEETQNLVKTLQSVGLDEENFHEVLSKSKINDNEEESIWKMIQALKKIAISLTLRNLSLMITLAPEDKRDSSKEGSWIAIDEKLFRFKISLIDLDPKPFSKLEKYVKDRKLF